MIVEIVILAMIAAFLGLRLYSVLGRRAEHEEEVIPTRFDQLDKQGQERPAQDRSGQDRPAQDRSGQDAAPASTITPFQPRPREITGFAPAIEQGLHAISAADRSFELLGFLEGAKAAYGMVLEAYWRGDRDELKDLCDADVYASFAGAIDAREAAGETLDNRLVRIEDAVVHAAQLDGRTARITVRFQGDIAAVTRNREGQVIAGSLDDAIETRDIWTFERDTTSSSPAWLLSETDEG